AGMGGAYTAVSEGTYGMYYNPAGISYVRAYEIQASHIMWFEDIGMEHISFVMPSPFMENTKMGFSFSMLRAGGLSRNYDLPSYDPVYLNSGVDWNEFSDGVYFPYNYSASAAYGIYLNEYISTGFKINFNSESMADYTGYNLSADMGLLYKMLMFDDHHLIGFGVAISNIGTEVKLNNMSFEPPKILSMGVSDVFEAAGYPLLLSVQMDLHVDYDFIFSGGAEYTINDIAVFRTGFAAGGFNHLTAGLGIKLGGFDIDYAFIHYGDLGGTHRMSAAYSWGAPPSELSVYPPVISSRGGSRSGTARFKADAGSKEKIKKMSLEVFGKNENKPAAVIEASSPDWFEYIWDGRDKDGRILPDGVYSARLKVDYGRAISESNTVKVEIDNTPPRVSVLSEPKLLRPGEDEALLIPAVFRMRALDRNGIRNWQLAVWDYDKELFFSASGAGAPPEKLVWDGRGNDGGYVKTGEIYYYSLTAHDNPGNKGAAPVKSAVILLKEIKLTFASDAIFEQGRANVKISAYNKLKEIKDVLGSFPDSDIKVTGYTDNREDPGEYGTRTKLSGARARAVKFFMVNLQGIDESRIRVSGKGETDPVAANSTSENRAKNRRVEIIIKSTVYK
ncbi:MAG: PorV/PorQ family protein, partial [bacterium]